MSRIICCGLIAALALAACPVKSAARQNQEPHIHQASSMPGMDGIASNAAMSFLLAHSSGTSVQPQIWPMPMVMTPRGNWNLMWMGQAFLAATQQSGPRGGDKVYSTNWGMLGAARGLGQGSLMVRGMISLEPATIAGRKYPLLFQTGETAFDQPIVDGQHPHDFFMELSGQYARPLGGGGMVSVYYGAIGDPALGPTAFPHRASAMEIPQAALSHHWQDSTHIASNVLTVGFGFDHLQIEGSAFHGMEPDEGRWDIDYGPMDSWSARLSVLPGPNWQAQFSLGRIEHPEATHDDDVVRTTASFQYVVPRGAGNSIATSVVWGRNYKTMSREASHALLAETVVPLSARNLLTARFEWTQRDELFAADHAREEQIETATGAHAFDVIAWTAGYTRELGIIRLGRVGIGGNVSSYGIDASLKPFYGDRPWGMALYVRLRLARR